MRFYVDIVDLEKYGMLELKEEYTDKVFTALRDVLAKEVGIMGIVSSPDSEKIIYVMGTVIQGLPLGPIKLEHRI